MPVEAIAAGQPRLEIQRPTARPWLARRFPRTNLWLVPTLSVQLALAAFVLAQLLDHAQHDGRIHLPRWLDQGSAADARELLSATAGAIITTLGLVLSITVLTLSIAATQFGQRMLRRYMRDRGTQISIGIFAATFMFSLLTLLSVRSHPGEREFVPWVSAWISTLLAVACIGVLIFFIHHVAQSIQVHHVVAEITTDLKRVVSELTADANRAPSSDLHRMAEHAPADSRRTFSFSAPATGFLRHIDHAQLIPALAQASMAIEFLRRPGEFVLAGAQLGRVTVDGVATDRLPEAVTEALQRAVSIGPDRTMRQDPEFALDQLVEIALRAMSPAVNDPVTMFVCAYWLGESLRVIARAPGPRRVHSDDDGTPRVMIPMAPFDALVRAAFDPLRWVAKTYPMASIRLLETIERLAPHLSRDQTTELWRQADQIRELLGEPVGAGDRASVDAAYERAVQALGDR